MVRLQYKVRVKNDFTRQALAQTKSEVERATRTIAQDLSRTASETTPHLSGDLSASYSIDYSFSSGKYIATVEFSVFNGGHNYAVAMHEWSYNLGDGSRAKGGGTGMSGTSYAVGNKFLTRVLEGEAEAYREYYEEKINNAIRRGGG